jgi:hypothetical protein
LSYPVHQQQKIGEKILFPGFFFLSASIYLSHPVSSFLHMQVNPKRYGLYLLRWQLSTPILAGVGIILVSMGQIISAIIANLIGGLLFFWVDRFIFTSQALASQWEVREEIRCVDCGKITRGYRLVKTENYDRTADAEPEFRCEDCSIQKSKELKERGIRH